MTCDRGCDGLRPHDTDVGANPEPRDLESDSFAYIEMLLEALPVLGKLVGTLDIAILWMPGDICFHR